MKFNLTSVLFFLIFFCGTCQCFALEDSNHESTATAIAQSNHQIPPNNHEEALQNTHDNPHHLPEALIDRVENETDTFQAKFFKMLFILALLIGFMIIASWSLKRLMKTKLTQHNTASEIKILETRYLSPRATLYLVEIHNQAILFAESPTAVTLLSAAPHDPEKGM